MISLTEDENKVLSQLNVALRKNRVIPPIRCVDGTLFSIQASVMHYCTPRDDTGPWTSYEVMVLGNEHDELLVEFNKGKSDDPYGWVPHHIVAKLLLKHGGIAGVGFFTEELSVIEPSTPPPCAPEDAW